MNKRLLLWGARSAKGKINQLFSQGRGALPGKKLTEELIGEREQKQEQLKEAGKQVEQTQTNTSYAFSGKELEKAMVMSVILGPPACRRRKRYEGNISRR